MLQFSTGATWTTLRRFVRDERGATAIEYALIASGVSIVIAATIIALGASVKGFYTTVAAAMN
jgi:pilus assembly protein Flp/PilA